MERWETELIVSVLRTLVITQLVANRFGQEDYLGVSLQVCSLFLGAETLLRVIIFDGFTEATGFL